MTFIMLAVCWNFPQVSASELRFAGRLKIEAYCLRSGMLVP
jgi:hypothetical protein